MTDGQIISPGAPALRNDGKPDGYRRKAAGVLRSAMAHRRGTFTVAGKLALLLARQRTPRSKHGGWEQRALLDSVAAALAEIDDLIDLVANGGEDVREAAKQRIRQLRVEAGYMRQVKP
jgi:hypothetical protein